MPEIYTIQEISEMIAQGKPLLLAGDEQALEKLPAGNWIAGTSAYFMTEDGGRVCRDRIFATRLPGDVIRTGIKIYNEPEISGIYKELPENSFGFVIIPGGSRILLSFALNAPTYENFGLSPLIGWISGIHMDDTGKRNPKVFNGMTGEILDNSAVIMQVTLPENKVAEVGILNIFNQSNGDTIVFSEDAFEITEAVINGKKTNFAKYLLENKVNLRRPLVADYYGVMVNISFRDINPETGTVRLYAPVFKHIPYRLANPVGDYVSEFISHIPQSMDGRVIFSCNCILNYIHSSLEGHKTPGFTGPITFGEIAYQLLNQTMTYLTINDISPEGVREC